MIRELTVNDISFILQLAAEVEHLFGPMVENKDFLAGMTEIIKSGNVFGYLSNDQQLLGAIAIDNHENTVEWLAVSSTAKGKGIGSKLVEKALQTLDNSKAVMVQTFASSIPEGLPAIKLYSKYGFREIMDAGKNPADMDTVIMKRDASTPAS